MELEDVEYHYSKLKLKGKSKTNLTKLELKPRTRRQGKCVGAALEFCKFIENKPQMEVSNQEPLYTFISNDIWFHLASYIAPEDVKRYSLICRQSANSVNSRTFWLQMYRRYCHRKKWILQLPGHLRMESIRDCDRNTMRQRVIQALFYCYLRFKLRLQTPYTLETLVGRTYVSSWYKEDQVMCYKFKSIFPINNATKYMLIDLENNENNITTDTVVDDWECLAEEENNTMCQIKKDYSFSNYTTSATNEFDGTIILIIYCDRFIPFPSDIICNHATNPFRLGAIRNLLATDMRSKNLELDLISTTRDQTITLRYTKIQKFKVLPWWHPDFRIFNKCE